MAPAREAELEERWQPRFVSGRALTQEVRADARRLYIDLIARLGATPCMSGKTLRQVLTGPGGYSRWWFLKTTQKDCVWSGDVTYLTLIRLICVRHAVRRYGVRRVRVFGGSAEFELALRPQIGLGRLRSWRLWPAILPALGLGVLNRAAFLKSAVTAWWILRGLPLRAVPGFDVLLEAHWDWSVQRDGTGGLTDRYFVDLPERLEKRNFRVGWLAWLEPRHGQAVKALIRAAVSEPRVVLLTQYLSLRDILRALADFRYLWRFVQFATCPGFRDLFRVDGLDLYPLVRTQLVRSLADSSIARHELIAIATERVCRQIKPRMVVTFLEFFLHARALYAGARLASPQIRLWAAQHAGYSSDKTLGILDPARELHGRPDGCAIPAPDRVLAMGELSRKLWRDSGFAEDAVVPTGGLRYQQVRLGGRPRSADGKSSVSVLLIPSTSEALDIDMCEAACTAARDLPSIRLRLRDHPFFILSKRRSFRRFHGLIDVTTGDLNEDLSTADLVLFTYSGVGEEAVLRGKPTWQWLWAGFCPSIFVDLPVIPAFASVRHLRRELERFVVDPDAYRPDHDVQEQVLRACFGSEPGRASDRIVELIVAELGRDFLNASPAMSGPDVAP